MQTRNMSDEEAMRDHLFGNSGHKSECHCQTCGAYVTDAESDAEWVGRPYSACPTCGPGTKIASVLRERLLI